jgi:hypothetical protein
MRTSILIGLLAAGLAGCGTVAAPTAAPPAASTSASALPTGSPSIAPSPAPSPTGEVAGETAPPRTMTLLQESEAFLVVWSKYHHVIDQINGRHVRNTVSDYRAWCKETDAAGLEFVDGLQAIPFGPDRADAADYLVLRAKKYQSRLEECAGYTTMARIHHIEPLLTKAATYQENAETALRKALDLPTSG